MTTFLRFKEVARRTGLSRAAIYDAFNRGDFPRPVKVGERRVAFVEAEVDEWIAARIAARDAALAA